MYTTRAMQMIKSCQQVVYFIFYIAHVKTPHIDVKIKGKGVEIIEKILKKAFLNIKITHDYDM